MARNSNKTTLNYSAPNIIMQGLYHWRNVHIGLSSIGLIAVGILFAGVGILGTNLGPEFRIPLGLAGVIVLSVSVLLVIRWLNNDNIVMQITHEGIRYGKQVWPWSQIIELGAYKFTHGVQIYIDSRHLTGRMSSSKKPVFRTNRSTVHLTPALTNAQFQRLAADLIEFLAERFPEVKIDRTPHNPPDWSS